MLSPLTMRVASGSVRAEGLDAVVSCFTYNTDSAALGLLVVNQPHRQLLSVLLVVSQPHRQLLSVHEYVTQKPKLLLLGIATTIVSTSTLFPYSKERREDLLLSFFPFFHERVHAQP